MSRDGQAWVLSANDLLSGEVVFFNSEGSWRPHLEQATVATDAATRADLLEAGRHYPGEIVGPYLVEVTLDEAGCPAPSQFRERVRTGGPTVARQSVGAPDR